MINVFSPYQEYLRLKKEIDSVIGLCLLSGEYVLGSYLKQFEENFSGYIGLSHGIGVNSGTDALFIALKALNIGPGDEVITVSNTYMATALAISHTGAKPVFVDIDKNTYTMDPSCMAEAINKKTKAIIPVHLYGYPCDMHKIMQLADYYRVPVVEDCCQAHGAEYYGKKVGSFGKISCFSFYPTKPLCAMGDGGMILTDDMELADKMLCLREYGRINRYEYALKGYNSRLDTLQAIILNTKLKYLDEFNEIRRKIAKRYNELFFNNKIPVEVPVETVNYKHVYHIYCIKTKNRKYLMDYLKANRVDTLIHYPVPIHLQSNYLELGYEKGSLPVTESTCIEILSLPMHIGLKDYEIEVVVDKIKEVLNGGM